MLVSHAKANQLKQIDGALGESSKCYMQQLLENSSKQTSANILINIGTEYIELAAFQGVLSTIVNGGDINVPHLLAAPLFNGSYQSKLLVTITRSS